LGQFGSRQGLWGEGGTDGWARGCCGGEKEKRSLVGQKREGNHTRRLHKIGVVQLAGWEKKKRMTAPAKRPNPLEEGKEVVVWGGGGGCEITLEQKEGGKES